MGSLDDLLLLCLPYAYRLSHLKAAGGASRPLPSGSTVGSTASLDRSRKACKTANECAKSRMTAYSERGQQHTVHASLTYRT